MKKVDGIVNYLDNTDLVFQNGSGTDQLLATTESV